MFCTRFNLENPLVEDVHAWFLKNAVKSPHAMPCRQKKRLLSQKHFSRLSASVLMSKHASWLQVERRNMSADTLTFFTGTIFEFCEIFDFGAAHSVSCLHARIKCIDGNAQRHTMLSEACSLVSLLAHICCVHKCVRMMRCEHARCASAHFFFKFAFR